MKLLLNFTTSKLLKKKNEAGKIHQQISKMFSINKAQGI